MMRTVLFSVCSALMATACATTSGGASNRAYDGYMPEFAEMAKEVGAALPLSLDDALTCIMDFSTVRSMTNEDGSPVVDDNLGEMYGLLSKVYRERVLTLEAEGEPVQDNMALLWEAAKTGSQPDGYMDAIDAYIGTRFAELEAEEDTTIYDTADTCRKNVVNQMSEEQISLLALQSIL